MVEVAGSTTVAARCLFPDDIVKRLGGDVMEVEGDGVDRVLMKLYKALLSRGAANGGQRGEMLELIGVTLRITNPRARISRSQDRGRPFSALGELLWYLKGSNELDFIEPYIPKYRNEAEDGLLYGAYGPRFRRMRGDVDQWANIINLLEARPTSKRAVIQIYDALDIVKEYKEIPCTSTMQFLIRDGRLNMSVTMRSNDAYKGAPHDIFCFTMLQEMFARRLGVELGEYLHYAGSMHVYDEDVADMERYVGEGWQRSIEMPRMSDGDPFGLVPPLLDAEVTIRAGRDVDASAVFQDGYWADVVRLLQVFWVSRGDDDDAAARIDAIIGGTNAEVYQTFLKRRRQLHARKKARVRKDSN